MSVAASVEAAVHAAARGDRQALHALLHLLADVDARGVQGDGTTALRVLAHRPAVLIRLDEYARREWWPSPPGAAAPMRFESRQESPVAVALASTHRDGHIRARAVAEMLDRPAPEFMPFLVLRTCDWVAQVRNRARGGLAVLLVEDPGTYLPAALPAAVLVGHRLRGLFASAQATAALIAAPAAVRRTLTGTAQHRPRRFLFGVALSQGWLGQHELIAAAESDHDVWISVRAAETVCRDAVWTRRSTLLERLARSRRASTRAIALTGLVRLGQDATVATRLADPAPLVRAVARAAARRCNIDVLNYYRAAATEATPAPGAIAGLAETGSATDAALLRPLLTHAAAPVRAEALRALSTLGSVDLDATIPLLRDPSPAVVREATTGLRPHPSRLPADLPWQLLTDPRAELRRAGYRLLREQPTAARLRAALTLTLDPDPALARRGLADVTGFARETTRTGSRRLPDPQLVATTAEHTELQELTHRADALLGPATTDLLTAWLVRYPPRTG